MSGVLLPLWVLLAHLVGDYMIQSDWMATEKTNAWWPAVAHGVSYMVPYALLTRAPVALLVIAGTHVLIDHYRLARHVGWAKNQLAPVTHRSPWAECQATGYPASKPDWMAVWLMIVTDNTIHLLINGAVIAWAVRT